MSTLFEVRTGAATHPDMWHLLRAVVESGETLDPGLLPRRGRYTGPRITNVEIDTKYPSTPVDFNFALFNYVVVKARVADLIQQHGGRIQRFPVMLSPLGTTGYEVIFTLDAPKGTINLSRADEFEFFEKDDPHVQMC